jgi:tetratricopeptide (TPR) repeat protein
VTDRQLQRIAKVRKQGKTDEALRMFKELVREPDASAAVHLAYGYMLDSLSREARAITHYTKALALGLPASDRVSCLVCLASSYRNRKRFDEALSTIEQAACEFPDNQVVVCFHALILSDLDRAEEGLARLGRMAVLGLGGAEMEPFRKVLLSRYRGLARRAKKKLVAQARASMARQPAVGSRQ